MRTKTRISNKLMRLGTLDAVQQLTRGFTMPFSSRFETGFEVDELEPLLYLDARTSMLNASSEQAGFLESVATLTDLAGSAVTTESVVDRRPTAMPLIDGKGYLYTSGVTGNYAEFDESLIPGDDDFELTVKFYRASTAISQPIVSQYTYAADGRTILRADNTTITWFVGGSEVVSLSKSNVLVIGENTVKITRVGSTLSVYANDMNTPAATGTFTGSFAGHNTRLAGNQNGAQALRGAYFSITSDTGVDCDFTTEGQHGASSFVTSTGQTVTINKTGLDPSLLLRRPVLRFDGASTGGDRMRGTLSDYISTAHAFLKFAVNGDSFADTSPTVLAYRRNSQNLWDLTGASAFAGTGQTGTNARSYFNAGNRLVQNGWWNDDNGTIVVEVSITNGTQFSKVNNANEVTDTQTLSTFGPNWVFIGHSTQPDSGEAPMDLEQIILFDRVVDESDANDLYNHIK